MKKPRKRTPCDSHPPEGSLRFRNVLRKGCWCEKHETMDGIEYDCGWDYNWVCDDCPVVIHKMMKESDIESITKYLDYALAVNIYLDETNNTRIQQ